MLIRLIIIWLGVFLLDLTLALRHPYAHHPFALLTKSKRSIIESDSDDTIDENDSTTATPITTPYYISSDDENNSTTVYISSDSDSDLSYPDSDYSDDSGFGRPTPTPRPTPPPPIFCRACIHHSGRQYPRTFFSKDNIHKHLVKDHEVDPHHINDPPGRYSLPYRCLECGAKCNTLRKFFDHYYYMHRPDPDPPRAPTMNLYKYQCPYCWGKIGFDLSEDEFRKHHMYYHLGRRLVQFPQMLMNQGDYSRVFSGKRLPFLRIINANKIADTLYNRASQQLLNNNVERRVQFPIAERTHITSWPSSNPLNFQRMKISTLDDNRPESNSNMEEEPITLSPANMEEEPLTLSPANMEEEPITLSPPGPSEIRVRPPISKNLAKGQSKQNTGKGKSGKSVYDPNKEPKDDHE